MALICRVASESWILFKHASDGKKTKGKAVYFSDQHNSRTPLESPLYARGRKERGKSDCLGVGRLLVWGIPATSASVATV